MVGRCQLKSALMRARGSQAWRFQRSCVLPQGAGRSCWLLILCVPCLLEMHQAQAIILAGFPAQECSFLAA